MKILVTGANGFIGQFLCRAFLTKGDRVRGAFRSEEKYVRISSEMECCSVGDIGPQTDWRPALNGIDIVVHLAGRAHILDNRIDHSLAAFRNVNVLGTERLVRAAAEGGIKKFIFISSVKVNGEGSPLPYTEKDAFNPQDDYAISKREAEDVVARIAAETGLKTVILRLPLVYGPGVKANFKNLIKIVDAGLPLPLKGINNKRSFIYLENLVGAIMTCAQHPKASGEIFLVSDGRDISTPDLIRMIAVAKNKKPRLFFVPPAFLKVLAKVTGKEGAFLRLTGSLVVDSSKIRKILGWKPPFTFEEGMKKTVEDYK